MHFVRKPVTHAWATALIDVLTLGQGSVGTGIDRLVEHYFNLGYTDVRVCQPWAPPPRTKKRDHGYRRVYATRQIKGAL